MLKLAELQIQSIDFVNVRYTESRYQREFTALITASVADYYMDDRDYSLLRGDTFARLFQEFWTFQFNSNGWRLQEIKQSRESNYLVEENFVSTSFGIDINKIYKDNAPRC